MNSVETKRPAMPLDERIPFIRERLEMLGACVGNGDYRLEFEPKGKLNRPPLMFSINRVTPRNVLGLPFPPSRKQVGDITVLGMTTPVPSLLCDVNPEFKANRDLLAILERGLHPIEREVGWLIIVR